ncbi:MAG: hypothetical protein ABEK75_00495 [Salinibacter sp.]
MRYGELLISGIVLFGLAVLPVGCDSGSSNSPTTESVVAEIRVPVSVFADESFQVTGNAYGKRTDDSRAPVDSIKLFFEGELMEASLGGSAVITEIDSSMISVGRVNVSVKAWKTVEEDRLSDEVSQKIKVLEAPP